MPNWCECDLTIEGPHEDVCSFLAYCGDGFDFNKFIPYPAKFAELDEAAAKWEAEHPEGPWSERPTDGFNSGGMEWCRRHWGTKWNASDVVMPTPPTPDGYDETEINFSTPWSPPLPVVHAASVKFPTLTFELRYFERGMEFNGIYRVNAGAVDRDEKGPYFDKRGG